MHELHSLLVQSLFIPLIIWQGETRKIVQLHCENWPDMEAPETTATLLDLIDQTQRVFKDVSGTMMVHCSAGVGRTGTFVGLFKLIQDYHNDKVTLTRLYPLILIHWFRLTLLIPLRLLWPWEDRGWWWSRSRCSTTTWSGVWMTMLLGSLLSTTNSSPVNWDLLFYHYEYYLVCLQN